MSIRLRFTLALAAVGLLLFSAYAVWAYRSEQGELRTAAVAELRVVGQSLETAVGNALRDRQRADIDETLATLEALSPGLDIHIFDVSGQRLTRSRGAVDLPIVAEYVRQVATSRRESIAFDPAEDPVNLIFTGPLSTDEGDALGVVVVVRPIADLTSDLRRTRNRLLIAMTTLLVATLGAGMILGTIHITRPIARLLQGIRSVREGDFRTRVINPRVDEVGELVAEFNLMIEALAATRARTVMEAEARSRLEAGLQQVDKLVTIGQLSAGLAHEIGSPLQVLSGRASALLDHHDPEVRRQAELLVGQCDRITRVVEQLLSFGRRKAASVVSCDLATPVSAVIELLAGEARRRGVSLSFETDGGSHQIVGDPDQLQQVALNLVRNALSATSPGGAIHVRIERVGEQVHLVVSDNGHGIAAEVREKLFEPFFTTRATEGGTGLGLSVVRAIATEHHARIEVSTAPAGGAVFTVSFPHHPEVANA